MKRKKPKKCDAEKDALAMVGRNNSREWDKDHCYHYPWAKKKGVECVAFLINMYAPTKSGYLMESAKNMWRKPNLIAEPDRAKTFLVAPQDAFEWQMRRQLAIPRYYVIVLLPKEEAVAWYGNRAAYKHISADKVFGQIEYF